MSKIDKIITFGKMAKVVSGLSKDTSTKVGAIILRPDFTIVSVGYNGFAKGVDDTLDRWNNRELKYKLVIHAEENAILTSKEDLTGYSLICTHYPCSLCASKIIQKGISSVYYFNTPRTDHNCELTDAIFKECRVKQFDYSEYFNCSNVH